MNYRKAVLTTILLACVVCISITAAAGTQNDTPTTSVVQAGKVTITDVTPLTGKLGEKIAFNITGTNFPESPKVYLEKQVTKNTKTIEGKNLNITTNSTISGTFKIPTDYIPGEWDVVVEQKDQKTKFGTQFNITR